MSKVGERIPPPLRAANLLISLSDALMGIVHSRVGSPNNDLCALWSIIAASETCLYPKSYLISGWVGPRQVINAMRRIGRPSTTDHTTIVEIRGARRVTGKRSSRAGWNGHVGLAKKLLRNAPTSPGLLTTLSKTLIGRSRPLIFIATPTPYLRPTCHRLSRVSSLFV